VISVDTFRAEVARKSIVAGAHVINDTSGQRDAAMAKVVAGSDAWLMITHSLAEPRSARPRYGDVVVEVAEFLRDRVAFAIDCGVPAERLMIDLGFDLDKNKDASS
jgi:dihydropteroate synthase